MVRSLIGLLVLGLSLLIVFYVFVIKRKAFKRSKKILVVVIMLPILICFSVFPLDNYIFSFSSPTDVAEYAKVGKVITSISNDEIGVSFLNNPKSPNSSSVVLSRKVNGKWKLSSSITNYFFSMKPLNDFVVSTYCSSHVGSVIIVVSSYAKNSENPKPTINDNHNSTFSIAKLSQNSSGIAEMYYTILDSADESYQLTINGESTALF